MTSRLQTHTERWQEMAHVRGKKRYVKHAGPEGCERVGIVAQAIYLDRFAVVQLCREGKLEGVEGPLRLSRPNGKQRVIWVKKDSLARYMEANKEQIALRALRKGILR